MTKHKSFSFMIRVDGGEGILWCCKNKFSEATKRFVIVVMGLFLVVNTSLACSGSLNYNSGSICPGGTADIVFQGSSSGVSYQLYKDGNAIGSTIQGGTSIQHLYVTGTGSYQVRVAFGNTNVCTSWSSNTVTVGLKSGASISINASPSSAICRGQSVTLTAQGGYGYSWSSQVVSPLVTTTYTLTGTESVCSTLSTATITVYVSPAVGQVAITSLIGSLCQGSSSPAFTASATDVNYYTWTIFPYGNGPGQAGTIDGITGVPTWNPNFSGPVKVKVKASSGQFCMVTTEDSRDITVLAMPSAPAVTNISVVYNSSITLQASGAGPNEVYTWYSSQNSTTPISSSVGPLNAASTYTYYAGKKNTLTGCETLPGQRSVLTVDVYVDPPPPPLVSTNTCGPRTITLPAPPANVTWYWQGVSSTSTDGIYPITSPYTYSIATSGTYYIRARANTAAIWSSPIAVSTIIDPVDIKILDYDPANPVVQATHSVILDEGFTVPSGSTFSVNIVITGECNDLINWSEQIIYDQNGTVAITDTRTYFNGFGDELESQSKDFLNKKVVGAQSLFNSFGKVVGTSLAAPLLENDFIYKAGLITNASGLPYMADDFDVRTATGVAESGEINYPKPVGNQLGTVGWYYSAANNLEPNTPVTQYPYSRGYSPEGSDPNQSVSAGPGDQFRMGSGHETKSEKKLISADDADKLSHYYALRHHFSSSTTASGVGRGYRYITTDANGKQAVSFVDADGRNIASAVATLASGTIYNYDYWSYTFYNDAGQVTATVAPKDVHTNDSSTEPPATRFQYDQLGRLIETSSPDEGTSRFVYSNDGKIRFSENQEQRGQEGEVKRFSYTNYDKFGRLVESGEYTASAGGYIFEPHSTINPSSNSVLNIVDHNFAVPIENINSSNYTGISKKIDPIRCGEHNFITYDLSGSGSPTTQDFLFGQVSKTENENAITWYSYDEDGLLIWMKQSISGLGTKAIDYTYDYFGNVTQVAYQAGQIDAFYHHYTYDVNQRLTEVYTSKDGTSKTLQAKYYYYLHGPLKRVELANNLQGIDYVYTIDGSLKSINHADVSKDPGGDGSNGVSPDVFGMTLEYHANDYQGAGYSEGTISGSGGTDYYNGLIKSASWFTPVDNPSIKKIYGYTYDNLYQFQNAQFGSLTGTAGTYAATFPTDAYRENVPAYDKNGNISSLVRKGKTANVIDNLTYNYTPGTNKLDNITGSTTISYQYNAIGQMTQQTEGDKIIRVAYNAYGLVKEVRDGSDHLLTAYSYDDHGDMVKRTIYEAGDLTPLKTTWYVHDAAGNVLAIYEQPQNKPLALAEVPIYGAGRIASYKPGKDITFYEVNDHLGNVRAVIGAPRTDVFTATMETETAGGPAGEDAKFKNIAPRVPFVNGTVTPPAQAGNEAVRLNNARPTGPAMILHVAPGDMISAEVYSYYEGGSGYSNTLPIASIVNSVAAAFGGVSGQTGDPGKIFSSLNTALNGGGTFAGTGGSTNDAVPAAYLNLIMFDENLVSNPVTLPMAAVPVGGGANFAKQKLTIGPINIPAPGYVYIYLNNNSNSANFVYFDDLKITHLHSPFVAGGDYYPFGLTMDDRQIKIEDYRYGYQGQYAEKDSVTGFNEFDLRMYDARTGRWISPDPYGQYASPYIGMGNNPVSGADPDGGFCCAGVGIMLPEVAVTASRLPAIAMESAMAVGRGFMINPMPEYQLPEVNFTYNQHSNYSGTVSPGLSSFFKISPEYQQLLNQNTISAYKPNAFARWNESSIWGSSLTYDMVNGAYVGASTFFLQPFIGNDIYNLDGSYATSRDRVEGFTTTAASLLPVGKIKSLRNGAVRKAWREEADLVRRTGQGTTNWSAREILELLSLGKVVGYIGHHINSVKLFPKLAGNPNNIRFIPKKLHLRLHKGNWKNSTKGKLIKR